MSERYRDKWSKWTVAACLVWGISFAALGILLCVTIVFSPLGVLCLIISGMPLAQQQKRQMERKRAWQNRERPLPLPEGVVRGPWKMEEELNPYRVEPDSDM